MAKDTDAVAAAYRTINEADPATADALNRLRGLYKQLGEEEAGEAAIAGMLESGPSAAARLNGTADAVARLHNLTED